MKNRITIGAILSLLLTFVLTQPARAYLHPGMPLTVADLDQLKTNINVEPWKTAYNALKADSHSSTNYVMQGPFVVVDNSVNLNQWQSDMQAVYNLARMWYFTGDYNYGQKAHDIWIAYANTTTNMAGLNFFLSLGDYTYRVFGGVDILRGTWPGWTAADTTASKNQFQNTWKPWATVPDPVRSANQGAEQLIIAVAIGFFNDDTNYVNQCLQSFRADACGGLADSLPNGELGDSGRDQGHAYGEMWHLAWCAEVFWKQGIDVYSELDNRLLAAAELYCRYNLGVPTPYVPFGTKYDYYWQGFGGGVNSSLQPPLALNVIYSAYVIRKGMSAPYLDQYRDTRVDDSDSFVYRKSADSSTATPPAPLTPPAATASATTGFLDADIGGATPAGSSSYNNGTWTITGAGSDISDSLDSFHFTYKQVTGDFTMIAKVTSLQTTNASAKAAFEIRDSLVSPPARRVYFGYTPGTTAPLVETKLIGYTADSHNDPDEFTHDGPTPMLPHWLKMQRIGSRITVFHSADGGSWTPLQNAEYSGWTGTAYIGMGVCSKQNGTLNTATFTDVKITGGDGGEAAKIPPAPSNIYGSPGQGQVPLRWLASFGATSYKVKRSTTSKTGYSTIASGLTNCSYVNTGLANGTTYYYVVSAVNAIGESPNSPESSVTTQDVPPAPTLTPAPGDGFVGLSWDEASGLAQADSYNVKRATVSGGPYTTIANVTVNSFVDGTAVNGTTYYYIVSGINGLGEGDDSAEAVATPSVRTAISINFKGGGSFYGFSAAMASTETAGWIAVDNWNNAAGASGTVSALAQSDGTATSASVNWAANGTYSTSITESPGDYRMMKGYLDTSSTSTTTVTVSGLPSTYTTKGYDVYVYCDGDNGSGSRTGNYTIGSTTIPRVDGPGQNFSGTYLQGNNYVVFHQTGSSFTLSATGDPADGGAARAPINGLQIVASVAPPPATPTGLQATTVSSSQINLSWTAASGATIYSVKRSTTSGGPYTILATGVSGTTYNNTGLSSGTTYYYVVQALNANGESADSTPASATTRVAVPPTPTGLNATAGNAQVALSWNASSSATSYNVKRSTTNGNGYATIASLTTTSYTDKTTVHGTTYYYVVSAVNGGGESVNSSQVSATPQSSNNGLPSPWVTADIGAVGSIGSAVYSNGLFTVNGSGADIWGTKDTFRYVYQPASGDCSIVAKVTSVENTSTTAKAGVMIRETTNSNSTYVGVYVTPVSGIKFERRVSTGGSAASSNQAAGITAPYWVRLARSGNTFTASISSNGVSWRTNATFSITMAGSVYIGLPVCSHNNTNLCTATFTNVTASP